MTVLAAWYAPGMGCMHDNRTEQKARNMEPRISINGTELTESQAMTLRVAVDSLTTHLQETGLGDDDRGKGMVALYLSNLRAISNIMAAT